MDDDQSIERRNEEKDITDRIQRNSGHPTKKYYRFQGSATNAVSSSS